MWKKFTYSLLIVVLMSLSTGLKAQTNARIGDVEYVKIYPNPVSTEATIKISDVVDLEKYRVSVVVYNIVGKEVMKISNIKESEVRFSRDNLPTGMYIFQLKIDDRTQSTGRLTIK